MTQNSQSEQYRIVGGPSREELFDGLRLAAEGRRIPITVETLRGHEVLSVTVQGIEREDGSGDRWLLKLYAQCPLFDKKLEAYYSSKQRTGWVRSAKK